MKTSFFALVFFLAGVSSFAQTYIGVKASMNASSLTSRESSGKLGYSVGGFMDIPISDSFYFSPNLQFSLNQPQAAEKYNPDFVLQAYSIEVPLLLSYRMGEDNLALALSFGPYFRYGLFGNSWTKESNGQKVKFNTFDVLKRFDYGPQGGVKLIMNEVNVGFSLQYGLIRPTDTRRGNNFTFNLTFGYSFEL